MKLYSSLALLSILLPTLLPADNIPVGNRAGPTEVVSQPTDEETEEELMTAGFGYDRLPPLLYSNAHHNLIQMEVRNNGEYTLELEDGSVWKISRFDGNKAKYWQTLDPLLITQNNSWFSKHQYRIINQATGSTVEASLFLGPLVGGEHSRYITSIDRNKGSIVLNDYTHWDISYLDLATFQNWALNDYIIIGTNSEIWLWQDEDTLLINVNMNNSVRAKQY